MAFSKYYIMVGVRIESPLSETGRPDYSQSDAPDVAAMGISDWSGCAPCLIFYISAETKVSNIVIVILYAEDNKLKLT